MNVNSLIRAGEQTKYISLDLVEATPEDLLVLGPGTERVRGDPLGARTRRARRAGLRYRRREG